MMNKTFRDRLFDRVNIVLNGCWDWTGPVCDGYGRFHFEKKSYKAHRASYLIHHGTIPDGKMVIHSCNNRRCVNPEHLRIGNHQDNMADRAAAGRYGRDFNGRTVISSAQAKVLRDFFHHFDVTRTELAQLIGVSKNTIGNVLKGEEQ